MGEGFHTVAREILKGQKIVVKVLKGDWLK